MRLVAYAKLLRRKINLADKHAQNPFIDTSLNPFSKPFYSTLVWVEQDDNTYKNKKY